MTLLGRLELRDFPRPEVARCLSPNASGKQSHWATKRRVRVSVQDRVWFEAMTQGLPEMHDGLIVIRPTFTYPVHRRRDIDNACTGVLKAGLDALVRGGWLQDDSSEHVRLEPPVIRVTPGVRMLVLEFEQAESVRPVLPLAQETVDLGLCHAEPGLTPADQYSLELTAPNPAAHGFRVDAQAIRDVLDGQHAFGGHDHTGSIAVQRTIRDVVDLWRIMLLDGVADAGERSAFALSRITGVTGGRETTSCLF